MRKVYLLTLFVCSSFYAFAQVVAPFNIRYQVQQKGSIVFLSNTTVTGSTYNSGVGDFVAGCPGAMEIPPGGNSNDNDFRNRYVDFDSDPTTYCSSSDSLALPTCSQVTFAGLYWGGLSTTGSNNFAIRNQCKFKIDNGAYMNFTADSILPNNVGYNSYHCFKDITALVQGAGINNRYTVANVQADTAGTNRFGGWAIVIVYKNDIQTMKTLTVFNGLSNVSSANPATNVTVAGFLTPLTGPVNFELGHFTYDGDRGSGGDRIRFNGAGTFFDCFDAMNPATNVMNSTVSHLGVHRTAPFVDPYLPNTLGIDADVIAPDNTTKLFIGNNATSATLQLTTGGETYLTQCVTMAIDVYDPDLRAGLSVVDIDGGLVEPGDTLEYTVLCKNIGSDPAIDVFALDTLEQNADYVPNSINIIKGPNIGAKTDAAGDDQAEYIVADRSIKVRIGTGADAVVGGFVDDSPTGIDSTIYTFRVTATTDCIRLYCDNVIDARAYLWGTGQISGLQFNSGSNPGIFDINGCPLPGSVSTPINTAFCIQNPDTNVANYCTNSSTFASAFPYVGYTYYDNLFNVVTTANGPGTYYAIKSPYVGCSDTIVIIINVATHCDIDGDGIDNTTDLDDDNDGILDTVEGTADSDGDGMPDYLDSDSDNDGIADVIEAGGIDANGDGIIDGFTDANSDGYHDPLVGTPLLNPDSDGDGRTDAIDRDSDNDGIPDTRESGIADVDGDGIADGFVDADDDGLSDIFDGVPLTLLDQDGDGKINSLDLDSDNDGLTDLVEVNGTDADGNGVVDTYIDADNDGYADLADPSQGGTPLTITNTDGDTTPNYLDLDSDNDGITDIREAGGTDVDGNGVVDAFADANNNGLADSVDPASAGTPLTPQDFDGDGFSNFEDADSDNDGITDASEAGLTDANGDGIIDGFADADNDGLANAVDPTSGGTPVTLNDKDGDGHLNYLDLDSDNDGITDIIEAQGVDTDGNGKVDSAIDVDGDGLMDIIDPSQGGTILPNADSDGDGLNNYIDLDADNDGRQDAIEGAGTDADNDGIIGMGAFTDTDNDGLSDLVDPDNGGTPLTTPDFDADNLKNFIDRDSDNDGITDASEMGANAGPTITDPNNDGIYGVGAIVDADNDGWIDAVDPNMGGTPVGSNDTDGDGHINALDLDSDNDGISDVREVGLIDNDNDGRVGTGVAPDVDQDGIPDANDPSFVVIPPTFNADKDGDTHRNYLDLDSDNDGIPDLIEGISTSTFVPLAGTDSDNDGLDDAYDPTTGGISSGAANVDGGTEPDYLDLDSDSDGINDVLEAGLPDPDANGLVGAGAGVLPDTDNDGLADAADVTPGWIPGNGQTPTSFPDVQDPGGDRDWREAPDKDNDGVLASVDPDDDNDGIPDVVEGTGDADGDGLANYLDLDSDNDGIPDCVEAGFADHDGNGLPGAGAALLDQDNDGTPDFFDPTFGGVALTALDKDNDGIPNYLDIDSDNDGITDVIEAGYTDNDNDGRIGVGVISDTDGDGYSNLADTNNGGTLLTILNNDNDIHPNYLDLDSDGDAIPDIIEAGGVDTNGDGFIDGTLADADGDGLWDTYDFSTGGDAIANLDTDGDGIRNYRDLDSDNDGIPDVIEARYGDANGDGLLDTFDDADNDGFDNTADGDRNNNGAPDNASVIVITNADGNGDGRPDSYPNFVDLDRDGLPNFMDIDSDNDALTDIIEVGGTDANTNGRVDAFVNADNDGFTDANDPISFCPAVFNGRATAQTNSGVASAGNALTNPPVAGTFAQVYDNNDRLTLTLQDTVPQGTTIDLWLSKLTLAGIADLVHIAVSFDNVNFYYVYTQTLPTNTPYGNFSFVLPFTARFVRIIYANPTDNGTIGTRVHGLTYSYNKNILCGAGTTLIITGAPASATNPVAASWPQDNLDVLGFPNFIDLDSDGDGIPDLIEAGGVDTNGDGFIDGVFADTDNDGLHNTYDINNGGDNILNRDTDGDGVKNFLDLDSDNDGITDVMENRGFDDNDNGFLDSYNDADLDGFDDTIDSDLLNDGTIDNPTIATAGPFVLTGPDTNGDGIPNTYPQMIGNPDRDNVPSFMDLDSDNDGLLDIIEVGGVDADGDGKVDAFADTDGDGWADLFDPTNAGTPLITCSGNTNNRTFTASTDNPDAVDRLPNFLDLDSDGDGIPDLIEAGGVDGNGDGVIAVLTDSDGDGIANTYDASHPTGDAIANLDSDADGIPNYLDRDSDNDGIYDVMDTGGTDDNDDAIIDNFVDVDDDGFTDRIDPDLGNDGTMDGPTKPFVFTGADITSDGIPDSYLASIGNIDGDLLPNFIDIDSDNDGIVDIIEVGGPDVDNDGRVDVFVDVDLDGIADAYDYGRPAAIVLLNTSGDGTPADGRPTSYSNADNTDRTGLPNFLDIDSDGDGIPDIIEAGGVDINGDGFIDGGNIDSDGDGLKNTYDQTTGGDPIPNLDTDGDGILNAFDLDSDNDGIPDVTEVGGVDSNGDGKLDYVVDIDLDGLSDVVDPDVGNNGIIDPAGGTNRPLIKTGSDTNSDGKADNYPNLVTYNIDNDDVPNFMDLDSDNDAISDIREVGGIDTDFDGRVDAFVDGDGDGWANAVDGDANNDNTIENFAGILIVTGSDINNDGKADSYPNDNADLSILPNFLDIDSDDDGIPDIIEAGGVDVNGNGFIDGAIVDVNGNGFIDSYDATAGGNVILFYDTDSDGLRNPYDIDSDQDGLLDIFEVGGADVNGDGRVDNFADTDRDGYVNLVDPDDQNDGINESASAFTITGPDADNNGVPDNYPTDNADRHGFPNFMDIDSDNDGIPDLIEAGGVDTNGDGFIDGAFADLDNDGFHNKYDQTTGATPIANLNTDADIYRNFYDYDSDNDGIPDVIEAGGVDFDGDGRLDGSTDIDNDGLLDIVDPDTNNDKVMDNPSAPLVTTTADGNNDGRPDSYPASIFNIDGDPLFNFIDLDSDNDGLRDIIEVVGIDSDNNGRVDDSVVDPDGDGWLNSVDSDPNNDGILDNIASIYITVGADADNNGRPDTYPVDNADLIALPNFLDIDSDGDGIPDIIEAGGTDMDGNGFIDGVFADSDNDGIHNSYDGIFIQNLDTDGDGIKNYIDKDSDNDGISDVIETGGVDVNGDGILDNFVDADLDGLDDKVDTDLNNDGIIESPTRKLAYTNGDADNNGRPDSYPFGLTFDNDSDGVPNFWDLDADNDGIVDMVEAGIADTDGNGRIDGAFADADNDGWVDAVDGDANGDATVENFAGLVTFVLLDANNDGRPDAYPADNADNTGLPNFWDLDSDNDGISDCIEAGGPDANGDGIIDGFVDFVRDGLKDNLLGNALPLLDHDGDGNIDAHDQDSDNDGIRDNIEAQTTAGYVAPTGTDTDNDGFDDAYDASNGGTPVVPVNFDSDCVPDYLDLDSDNDGVTDAIEGGATDADGDGEQDVFADSDDDGLADVLDGNNGGTYVPIYNSDASGNPDFRDRDSDADGLTDTYEAGGVDANADGIVDGYADTDCNGYADALDFDIAGTPLPISDFDGDGKYNGADRDSDNDGISDNVEAQSTAGYIPPVGTDTDGDGIDNAYDTGTPITVVNTDANGQPDYIDRDSDGDGIPDVTEAGGTDANHDGIIDGFVDANLDGWNDATAGSPLPNPDTDGDTKRDFRDVDADNDGIWDVFEGQTSALLNTASGVDTDGDGIDDNFDGPNAFQIPDIDGDGTPDYKDLNTDADAYNDWTDAFDSDCSGQAFNDLMAFAATYETNTGNGFYTAAPGTGGNLPDWLEGGDDGQPNFLDHTSPFYHDVNNNGIVDIFDAAAGGTNLMVASLGNCDFDAEYDWRDIDNQVPLPVEILAFTAIKNQNKVDLKWIVASERNVLTYVIERYSATVSATEILSQPATGNSTYNDVDNQPLSGKSWYRLKAIDVDAKVTYSNWVEVIFEEFAEISIYPNPTRDNITINGLEIGSTVVLQNSLGQVIHQETANNITSHVQLRTLGLSSGVYFVKIINNSQEQIFKIVLN